MRADRLLRSHLRTRYLFTLDSREAFEGVLIDADAQHVVIADADSVTQGGERVKVDGHLWLPRTRVLYMQQPKV